MSLFDITLTEKQIYLGIPKTHFPNQIINIIKQSIVLSRCKNRVPTLESAIFQIQKIYNLEYQQSVMNKSEQNFENKWKILNHLLLRNM
jgi:hypothetical protein